jgi:hypothetical protein
MKHLETIMGRLWRRLGAGILGFFRWLINVFRIEAFLFSCLLHASSWRFLEVLFSPSSAKGQAERKAPYTALLRADLAYFRELYLEVVPPTDENASSGFWASNMAWLGDSTWLEKLERPEDVYVPTRDPVESAEFEHDYLDENPCRCGGKWRMLTHDSPFPSGKSSMKCVCPACGRRKTFVFHLW